MGVSGPGGSRLRIEPDGTRLTVLAHNFRNAYELAVDSFGDLWQNDNDDQVMTCRMTWLMEGANAGYFSADGSRYWQADRRPGQDTFTAHWHQDDPGVLPAGDNTGAGAPAGVVRYEGDQLGQRYRGLLLSADAGRNVIFGYLPKTQGAGFALERFDFLSSLGAPNENYVWNRVDQDPRKWFRPSDVAVGADGAIYVADWYDPIVGGHQMQDVKGYGRIYRITPKGRALTTPSIDLSTTAGQIQALLNPAVNVRSSGFERLKARGAGALPAVKRILSDANPFHRARAIWLLAELGPAGVREVELLLDDPNPQIRITAFRALRHVKASVIVEARRLSRDPSPAVRREVALSLARHAIRSKPRRSPGARSGIRRRRSLVPGSTWHGGVGQGGGAPCRAPARARASRSDDVECAVLGRRLAPASAFGDRRPSRRGRHRLASRRTHDDRRWWHWASSTIPAPRRRWPS